MTHHSPTLDAIIIAERSGLVNLQTVHFPIFDRFFGSLKSNKSADALFIDCLDSWLFINSLKEEEKPKSRHTFAGSKQMKSSEV